MNYQSKNYDHLLGIVGLSDQLLKNHFYSVSRVCDEFQ